MERKNNIGRLCVFDWCGDDPMEFHFIEDREGQEPSKDSESIWRVVDESGDGTELIVEEVGRLMVLTINGNDIRKAIICQGGRNEGI